MLYRNMERKEEKMSSVKTKVKMFGPQQVLALKYALFGAILSLLTLTVFLLPPILVYVCGGSSDLWGGLLALALIGVPFTLMGVSLKIADMYEDRKKELFGS